VFTKSAQGLKSYLQLAGPTVKRVDDHDIELSFDCILKKLAEDRPAGDGIDVRRLASFRIDADDFPAPVLAEFPEQTLLGVEGMPINLRGIGHPDIADGSHRVLSFSPILLEATERAIPASVSMKCLIINSSTSPSACSSVAASVYASRIRVKGFEVPFWDISSTGP
jgi:hypothetical protein